MSGIEKFVVVQLIGGALLLVVCFGPLLMSDDAFMQFMGNEKDEQGRWRKRDQS